jgi:hypothetical protein
MVAALSVAQLNVIDPIELSGIARQLRHFAVFDLLPDWDVGTDGSDLKTFARRERA